MTLRRSLAPPPRARCLLLALLALLAAAPCAQAQLLITHADQPARLLRKTTLHQASAGVPLQTGDIVESGAAGVQIEVPQGARLALGPGSSVHIDQGGATPSFTLLRGWLKLALDKGAPGATTVSAGALQVLARDGAAIVHADAGLAELYAESGSVSLKDLEQEKTDKGAAPRMPLNREQYALRPDGQPLAVEPRAPKRFVAAMPRAFFDPLIAVVARVRQPAAPRVLREASADDLAGWNAAPAALRKRLAARFSPRLADPEFRAAADGTLAADPDWQQAIAAQERKPKPAAVSNSLF